MAQCLDLIIERFLGSPPFLLNPSFVELLSGLRQASRSEDWNGVVLSLSYRLIEMLETGKEEDARRVLRFFARHVRVFASEVHPLAKLAETFENAHCDSLATLSYTYAYVYTRGRGGWGSFGDKDSRYLIEAAIRINREVALQVVANEISYRLRGSWYSFGVNTELITQVPKWDKNVSHVSLWYVLAHFGTWVIRVLCLLEGPASPQPIGDLISHNLKSYFTVPNRRLN